MRSIWNKKPWWVSWLSDTLLLLDVSENFRAKCIEIYAIDPFHFLSAPGLASQASLNKDRSKIRIINRPDMLLMVEEGILGGICQAIYRYVKGNNKYMSNYDKRIITTFLMYLDANNL